MRWSGLSDVRSGCGGGGHSNITLNDPPAAALQTALHTAQSGREGGKGGDGMWEAPPPVRFLDEKHFFWHAEDGLNKQAALQPCGIN